MCDAQTPVQRYNIAYVVALNGGCAQVQRVECLTVAESGSDIPTLSHY